MLHGNEGGVILFVIIVLKEEGGLGGDLASGRLLSGARLGSILLLVLLLIILLVFLGGGILLLVLVLSGGLLGKLVRSSWTLGLLFEFLLALLVGLSSGILLGGQGVLLGLDLGGKLLGLLLSSGLLLEVISLSLSLVGFNLIPRMVIDLGGLLGTASLRDGRKKLLDSVVDIRTDLLVGDVTVLQISKGLLLRGLDRFPRMVIDGRSLRGARPVGVTGDTVVHNVVNLRGHVHIVHILLGMEVARVSTGFPAIGRVSGFSSPIGDRADHVVSRRHAMDLGVDSTLTNVLLRSSHEVGS